MHTLEEEKDNETTQNMEKHQEELNKILAHHKADDPFLDLSNKSLIKLPAGLFILAHIQHLYLEDNHLVELPGNFFDRLPALEWLDLRNNQLKLLPASVGRHQSIKNLLLEGNKITHLPLQLGLTKTLNGLSLQGNPLQFPPQHIIDQGVYVILSFLYQELQNRSRQAREVVTRDVEKLQITVEESEEEEDILTEDINITGRKLASPMSDDYQLLRNGLTPNPASLHRPVTYQEYKGRFHTSRLPDSLGDHRLKDDKDLSLLHLRHQAEERREKLRVMKERQSTFADQRRKSHTAQETWRNDRKTYLPNGPDFDFQSSIQVSEPSPIEIHHDVREEVVQKVFPAQILERKHSLALESVRPDGDVLLVTPLETKQILEEPDMNMMQRINKLRSYTWESPTKVSEEVVRKNEAIHQRIKKHSRKLHSRMKERRVTEDSTDESPTSRELQRQLLEAKMKRHTDLEYRFKAFTGDSHSTKSDSQKTTST